MGAGKERARLMKIIKQAIAIAFAFIITAGISIPCSVFAYDYEYGYDDYETERAYVQKDTEWFYDDPESAEYTIRTEAQLIGLESLINEEQYDRWKDVRYEDFEGVTIKLDRDIKLTQPWTPIGNGETISFRGTFDGNGHTISGLDVDINGGYCGLFGYLSGTVSNLNLKGSVKSSGSECGAFAGYISPDGTVSNCTADVSVKGKSKTGGIVGYNDGGAVIGCVNNSSVSGTMKVGGVVGENWGSVIKCGNRGDITSSERGATTYGTGGVAGRSVSENALIDRCFNTGSIVSATEGTGGITGYINATGASIKSSYNTGSIKVKNKAGLVDSIPGFAGGIAGIVGIKGVVIRDCYACCVISNSDYSGGIIGKYFNDSKFTDEPYINNNYYLKDSGIKGVGSNNEGKAANIPDGTSALSPASFTGRAASFGTEYVDDRSANYGNSGYPVLKWQTKLGKVEKKYMRGMSIDLQKDFDRYLNDNSGDKQAGWGIMKFFNVNLFINSAIGNFYEK